MKHYAAFRHQNQRKISYLSLISTFNKWVQDLSLRSKPIRDLGKKNAVLKWTADHQKCLKDVKEAITNNIPLEPFEPTADSICFTDASTNRVGFVFIQTMADQKVRVIACSSTGLKDAQTRYSIYDLRMAAIAFALATTCFW